MGDFRFHLKIEFHMGPHSDKTDMSLNWSPDETHGLTTDYRVIEWLENNFEEGVATIRQNINDHVREQMTMRERQERDS